MTPARLEELRQLAGAVDGPKSGWMDELIEEVDRLKDAASAKNDLRTELSRVDAVLLAVTVERDNVRKMLDDANAREEMQLRIIAQLRTAAAAASRGPSDADIPTDVPRAT